MFSTKLKLTGTYSHCTEVVHDHDIIVLFLCMHHTGLKYFRVCQAAPVSEIITTKFSKLYIHAGMHACYFILTYNTYNIITLTCSWTLRESFATSYQRIEEILLMCCD